MRTRSLTFIKDRFNHIAYHIYVYREFFVVFCCRSLVNRILKIEFYILCLQSCVFIVQPSSFFLLVLSSFSSFYAITPCTPSSIFLTLPSIKYNVCACIYSPTKCRLTIKSIKLNKISQVL